MYRKVSIIISIILVTAAAILTVQSSSPSLSMLQNSYAQSCPDGSTPDASGNCPTLTTPPAGDEETAEAPPAGDGETAEAPPAGSLSSSYGITDGETAQAPPPATTETPPPATEAPPATTETPPPATTQAPPAVVSPQGSNNTGNATGVDANSILAVYNRERAAVGVPPYVWDDTLAAHAQAWVDYLAAGKTGGRVDHCQNFPEYQQIEECSHVEESETLALTWPGRADPADMIQATWMQEKPTGHYTAIVSTNAKSVGCGFATSTSITDAEGKPMPFVVSILGCRYQ